MRNFSYPYLIAENILYILNIDNIIIILSIKVRLKIFLDERFCGIF